MAEEEFQEECSQIPTDISVIYLVSGKAENLANE